MGQCPFAVFQRAPALVCRPKGRRWQEPLLAVRTAPVAENPSVTGQLVNEGEHIRIVTCVGVGCCVTGAKWLTGHNGFTQGEESRSKAWSESEKG